MDVSTSAFTKEYIWGFAQGNPMHYSSDKTRFHQLINLVVGKNAAITIGASFHPYQLINGRGIDIWETVLNVISVNSYCDLEALIKSHSYFHMNPPDQSAFPVIQWQDERLFTEANPEFGTYVPFVIPYLRHDDGNKPFWLVQIETQMSLGAKATGYIEQLNDAMRFLMPPPAFILGFDVFNKHNPSEIVNHFVDFLESSIKPRL
jgi:hypothetical protein